MMTVELSKVMTSILMLARSLRYKQISNTLTSSPANGKINHNPCSAKNVEIQNAINANDETITILNCQLAELLGLSTIVDRPVLVSVLVSTMMIACWGTHTIL